MNTSIKKRILALRQFMKKKELNAIIIPTSDPHLSEYTSEFWKIREWITGFTGSAGTAVFLLDKAALWTDSRYFLQADQELTNTGIKLFKIGTNNTPNIINFLSKKLSKNSTVGINGFLFSINEITDYQEKLSQQRIKLLTDIDPFTEIWSNRPSLPINKIELHPIKYSGIHSQEKIQSINSFLEKKNADYLFLSNLDEIAWTLNLRGNDVHCTPVFISYLLIGNKTKILFVNKEKISPVVQNYLETLSIKIENYNQVENHLFRLKQNKILLSFRKTNYKIYHLINQTNKILDCESPITLAKAIKNKTEIKGIYNCMKRDGIALVKFFMWLEDKSNSQKETEVTIAEKLKEFRSKQALFKSESFDTIAGYQSNGAIVHYKAETESCKKIEGNGLLLIDSGAQYLDGTTDITRTIGIGTLSEEERKDYTLVLKGHINLAKCKFPEGTRGTQLDILAREYLWKEGYNYLHGTGHGVGSFLGVHEGPQSIRMNENPIDLVPGMLISNEPGLYQKGKYGIRIENLILVKEYKTTNYGNFYQFETVTLCPIDTKPIKKELLEQSEISWLNNYHKKVFDFLSPYLKEKEKTWLSEKTKQI
jgi:Xaa-Pro aminopeptidase